MLFVFSKVWLTLATRKEESSVKFVIILIIVPNKHVKRFAKLVALAVIRTGKIAIKRLLNAWLVRLMIKFW